MQLGKLYKSCEEQFVTDINYMLLGDTRTNVSGELLPTAYCRISDGEGYIVELEDNQRIICNLRKNFNRPVISLPPRFSYRFSGVQV